MATITYQCICGKSYRLADDKIGQKVRCAVCGESGVVGESGNSQVRLEASDLVQGESIDEGMQDEMRDIKPIKSAARQKDRPDQNRAGPIETKSQGFVESNLLPNERIIHTTKLHWMIYLGPTIFFLGGSIMSVSGWPINGWVGFIIALISLARFFVDYVRRRTSEFVVTNKRILATTGFIQRDSFEIMLAKVESIQVKDLPADQGSPNRSLMYGTLVVVGSGGSSEPFEMIENPMAFRRAVQEQVDLIGA